MSNDRNQKVKMRILEWEEENHKKLEDCSRKEWIAAMQNIMCLTESEARDVTNELLDFPLLQH